MRRSVSVGIAGGHFEVDGVYERMVIQVSSIPNDFPGDSDSSEIRCNILLKNDDRAVVLIVGPVDEIQFNVFDAHGSFI
jgi:hypothetical protein